MEVQDEKFYITLQKSYIKLWLNQQKPHLEFQEFKCIKKRKHSSYNTEFISSRNFGHAKVFDQLEQRYKLLIICLSKEHESQISLFQNIFKNVVRSDIILNLINQYYLDADKLFYVFEMEYLDQSLDQFYQKYLLKRQIIKSLKDKICQYFKKSLDLYNDYADEKNGEDFLEFFIQTTQQNKIQVKLNLVDPNFYQQKQKYSNYEENLQQPMEESFENESEKYYENSQQSSIQEEPYSEEEQELQAQGQNRMPQQLIKKKPDAENFKLFEEVENKSQQLLNQNFCGTLIHDSIQIEDQNNKYDCYDLSVDHQAITKENHLKCNHLQSVKQNQVETEQPLRNEETEAEFENQFEIEEEIHSQDGSNVIDSINHNQPIQKQPNQPENSYFNHPNRPFYPIAFNLKRNKQKENIDSKLKAQQKNQSKEFISQRKEYLDRIIEISDSVQKIIKKCDLVNDIQNVYYNILNFHPLKIFEIIQEHPKYQSFEVISSTEQVFSLKIQQQQGQTVQLEGFQFNSIEKAQKLASLYEQIIKKSVISSTFINVELITVTQQQFYVLVEREFIENLDRQQNNLYRLITDFNSIKKFITLSYELFIKDGIQITNINPKNLLWRRQMYENNYQSQNDSREQFNEYSIDFTIEQITLQDFQEQYTYIIESKFINSFYQFKNFYLQLNQFRSATQNLVKEFFLRISECQQENITKTFNRIQIMLNNIISMQYYIQHNQLQIQCSKDDICKIQIIIKDKNIHQHGVIKAILDMYKNNPSIQIIGLKLGIRNLANYLDFEIQSILSSEKYETNQKIESILQLESVFSKYQNQFMREVFNKFNQFMTCQLKAESNLIILDSTFFDDLISQIINSNQFTENQVEEIKNKKCTALELSLKSINSLYKLKILIFDENIFYLVGDGPYLLLKYENYNEVKDLIKVVIFLQDYKSIFGLDYLHKFNLYQTTNLEVWITQELVNIKKMTLVYQQDNYQVNTLGFNQIIQLNLEMYQFKSDTQYDFSKIVQQIDQTKINTIKLTFTKFRWFRIYQKCKIASFYKLKNLVTFSVNQNYIDNGGDDDDELDEQQFYENEYYDPSF